MKLLYRLRHSQFLRQNTVFFLGSVAVGALNYMYYPVLSRMLPPAAFGEVQALISLFLQLSIFLTVLSLVVVTIVANTADTDKRNALVFEFEKLALLVAASLGVASLLFGSQLQAFFRFSSPWPFAILALAIVVTVPFILRGAVVRGEQRFGLVAAGNMVGAAGKIIFAVILVALGMGTAGAIGGLVVAQLAALGFVAYWAARLGLRPGAGKRFGLPDMQLLRPELRYGLFVLIGSLAITLQYSVDIIVIKHYFDAHTAGLYAGIASVARIVFFLTASVAQVLIAAVRLNRPAAQNRQLLSKSIGLVALLGLPALVVFAAAPAFVTTVLMGESYDAMAGLLPRLGLAIFIVSLLNVIVAYYLALRRYGIAVAASLGVVFTGVLIMVNHQDPTAIVNDMLWGSTGLACFIAGWVVSHRIKEELA